MRRSDDPPQSPDSDAFEDPEIEGLIDDLPLDDGTADTDAMVICPYCAESVEIALDPGSGPVQEYVEDCGVCCQPWGVSVVYHADGHAEVTINALDP